MFPLFEEPLVSLSDKQKLMLSEVPGGLLEYFSEYKNSTDHVQLILFTTQNIIMQNDRFSESGGDDLVDKLGVAADYFSRVIQVVDDLIQADPSWYRPWLIRVVPELERHAKLSQKVYAHFSYLSEPPVHMQAWTLYALTKSVEAALSITTPPADWAYPGSFNAKTDELLTIEYMSQLVLRFFEFHNKPG